MNSLAKLDFAINSVAKETNCHAYCQYLKSDGKRRTEFVTDMLKKACEAKN